MASERELNEFLKGTEKRAFKRTLYHVRNQESALDIVQDSMMRLAEHYGDKPVRELPMLFQRILANCTMDWFRQQKARGAVVTNFGSLESNADQEEFDLLDSLDLQKLTVRVESSEKSFERAQQLLHIEAEIQELPARQREAFLLRYWEELDLAETATAMGCTQGSVKTHCWRAIQTLANALKNKGIVT